MTTIYKTTQQFLNLWLGTKLVEDGIVGRLTNAAMQQGIERMKNFFQTKNYVWDTTRPNLIGIRTSDVYTNEYDDWFLVVTDNYLLAMPCTTKAGLPAVINPVNSKGTGTLVPKQYRRTYRYTTAKDWKTLWLGNPYFMQVGLVAAYRDNNRNTIIDKNIIEEGYFGMNIHIAKGIRVWGWSAGCQTIPEQYWIPLVNTNIFVNNNLYDYTLTLWKDLM